MSNLNDPDDDNDGIDDTTDAFAVDPNNGTTTSLPVTYDFSPNSVPDSLLGLGFTGLMTNGSDGCERTGAATTGSTIIASAKLPVKHIPTTPTPGPPKARRWAG